MTGAFWANTVLRLGFLAAGIWLLVHGGWECLGGGCIVFAVINGLSVEKKDEK